MYFEACTLNLAEFNVISAPFKLKFSIKSASTLNWSIVPVTSFVMLVPSTASLRNVSAER